MEETRGQLEGSCEQKEVFNTKITLSGVAVWVSPISKDNR